MDVNKINRSSTTDPDGASKTRVFIEKVLVIRVHARL